jgi:hypothetical protein
LFVRSILGLLGKRVAHKAVAHHSRRGGIFDFRFGFELMIDRRVPFAAKFISLVIGLALTGMLLTLEAPLELLLGAFLPLLGFAADAIVDGLEIVVLPLLFASLLLPHLAPKSLVGYLRATEPRTAS